MAEERGKRITNLLEREQEEKRKLRVQRRQANIEKQKAENPKLAPKLNPEDILMGLMEKSRETYIPKTISKEDISEIKLKTDNAIEAQLDAEERLKTAEEKLATLEANYNGKEENKEKAFEQLRGKIEEYKVEAKKMKREADNAKRYEKCLIGFKENGPQITKIYNLEQKTIARKQKHLKELREELSRVETRNDKGEIITRAGINSQLKAVNKIVADNEKEIKTIREEQKKIDKELVTLIRKTEKFGQGKEEITEEESAQQIEDLKRISDLSGQKTQNENKLKEKQSDKTVLEAIANKAKLEEKAKEIKAKIKLYEKGESQEDKVINKCKLARQMLLAGKTWEEINLASIEQMYEKQAEKVKPVQTQKPIEEKEPEQEPEQNPKHLASEQYVGPEPKEEPKPRHLAPEQSVEQEQEEEKLYEDAETEPLPPVPLKFEERHPKLAKIPFLASFVNGLAEGRRKAIAKKNKEEKDQNDDIEWEKEEVPEEEDKNNDTEWRKEELPKEESKQKAEAQEQNIDNESTKIKRDKFMEYLREAVEEGHTEQFKYSTREGLKDKEMRDRIDVRTQKEAEIRANGEENKEQQSEGREPGDN